MRHGMILGIAAIAAALALGALLADWESAPGSRDTALPNVAMQEGRAATATDPANPAPERQIPQSLLD